MNDIDRMDYIMKYYDEIEDIEVKSFLVEWTFRHCMKAVSYKTRKDGDFELFDKILSAMQSEITAEQQDRERLMNIYKRK